METENNREDDMPEAGMTQDEVPEVESEAETEGVSEVNPEDTPEGNSEEKSRRPSVVINVYSWATPIVGVLMLAIGLLAGYFGRPLIGAAPKAEAEPTVPAAAVQSANPTEEAQRQEMMGFLVGQVKHFKGEPDAPVTVIEFSDFQ